MPTPEGKNAYTQKRHTMISYTSCYDTNTSPYHNHGRDTYDARKHKAHKCYYGQKHSMTAAPLYLIDDGGRTVRTSNGFVRAPSNSDITKRNNCRTSELFRNFLNTCPWLGIIYTHHTYNRQKHMQHISKQSDTISVSGAFEDLQHSPSPRPPSHVQGRTNHNVIPINHVHIQILPIHIQQRNGVHRKSSKTDKPFQHAEDDNSSSSSKHKHTSLFTTTTHASNN